MMTPPAPGVKFESPCYDVTILREKVKGVLIFISKPFGAIL